MLAPFYSRKIQNSGGSSNFMHMLFPSACLLQIFVQLSFCSLKTQEIPFIFSDCSVELSFTKEVEKVNFSLPADPNRDQYNPIIFGQETFISVFEKIKYLVKNDFSHLSFFEKIDSIIRLFEILSKNISIKII